MKINLDNATDDGQIQILPLIDVIFCILTFFILAVVQTERPQAVNVDLPQARTGTVQAPDRLIITLRPGGQILVGQEEVADRAALIDRAKTYLVQRPDGLLVLNASQTAMYSDVVGMLDSLREVGGARRVALATKPKIETTPPPNPYLPNPYLPNPSSNPYGTPSGFPGSNPSGLPSYGSPGSNPLLYPDRTLGIPGASPNSPGLTPNPTIPNPGNPNLVLPNTPTTTPPKTGSGAQDFNTKTQTIPLTPR
ncbi:MAG: biopolymer transporter ExbD [Cyanobacteria bacterium]|nr:biopolymer transporter ExbD [Cyanobacteriota bacterium]